MVTSLFFKRTLVALLFTALFGCSLAVSVAEAITPKVAVGGAHSLALTSSGMVYAWGLNNFGQLGDGTMTTSSTPVLVSGLDGPVLDIAAGDYHSVALLYDGTVKTWGSNSSGQLGDGTQIASSSPVTVSGLGGTVVSIAAGGSHTVALMSDGTVKAWGSSYANGTTTWSSLPNTVSGFGGTVAAIAAGSAHNVALMSDGSVKVWGFDGDGNAFGDGQVTYSSTTPVNVIGLSGTVTDIAAGLGFTLAKMSNGTVMSWGGNNCGQLGDGTKFSKNTPVTVSGLSGTVVALAAGNYHSMALMMDGSVMSWGFNGYGQLGDGTTISHSSPVVVNGLSGSVSAIDAGWDLSVALMSSGGGMAWGTNSSGQLGNGTSDYGPNSTPVEVILSPEWDITFGGGGIVYTYGPDGALASQPDGKFIFAGSGDIGRYDISGTRDESFNISSHPQFGVDDSTMIFDIDVQDDEKILIAGGIIENYDPSLSSFFICRHNTDGTFDNSFDLDGCLRTSIPGDNSHIGDLLLQADGKIIAVGMSMTATGALTVVRYNSNGTLDGTFGTGGIAQYDLYPDSPDHIKAVLRSDGKIIIPAGGFSFMGPIQLLQNGVIDNAFVVRPPGSPEEYVQQIFALSSGKLIGVGMNGNVVRFNADGSVDRSYGNNGVAYLFDTAANPNYTPYINDALLTASESLVAVGTLMDNSCGTPPCGGSGSIFGVTSDTAQTLLEGGFPPPPMGTFYNAEMMPDGSLIIIGDTGLIRYTNIGVNTVSQGTETGSEGTDTTPPAMPTQLDVTDLGTGKVLVSWSNPQDLDFDHVEIFRSVAYGQPGTSLGTVTGSSYSDSAVSANTTYHYSLVAFDTTGNSSAYTTQVPVTTSDFDFTGPAVVTGVLVTDLTTGGAIDLQWTNPADADFVAVRIYRSILEGAFGSLVQTVVGSPSATGSWQDTGLTNGVTYYYRFSSVDQDGNQTTNVNQFPVVPTSAADSAAAGEVTGLSITDPALGGVLNLSWVNPTDPDFAFVRIYRSSQSGDLGNVAADNLTGTSWQNIGLTSGTDYYYTVRTVDSSFNESPGVAGSGRPTDTVPPPSISRLKATPLPGSLVELSWTASASADVNWYSIFTDYGSGTIDYMFPLAGVAHPATSYVTPPELVFPSGVRHLFAVRAEDMSLNPELNNTVVVSVVPLNDPTQVNASTRISSPGPGAQIGGAYATVTAEHVAGPSQNIDAVCFEYRVPGSGELGWMPMDVVDALDPCDSKAPYSVQWNIGSFVHDTNYEIRALTFDSVNGMDPNYGYVTVTINHSDPVFFEGVNPSEEPYLEQKVSGYTHNLIFLDSDRNGTYELQIPAGALYDPMVTVTMTDLNDTAIATLVPAGYENAGGFIDISFGNGQNTLDQLLTAKISIPYLDDDDDNLIDGTGINVFNLQICNYHGIDWTCLDSAVDTINKTVSAQTGQFSPFGLLVPPKLVGSTTTMLAVPITPNPNNSSSVFGSVNRYGGKVARWNPSTSAWEWPTTIEPGKGYFVWGNGGALNVSGTETPQNNFDITLQKGWNMIGNPFRYKVKLSDLTVTYNSQTKSLLDAETAGWLIGTVFAYQSEAWVASSVQDAAATLPTWTGVYILSDVDCTLTVPPTPAQ